MLKRFCSRIIGLQQSVTGGVSRLSYKQPLFSTSACRPYGGLVTQCVSVAHSVFGNSILPSLKSSAPLLQPRQQIIQPCRTLKKIIYTRIMYRLRDGEPETYQEAIDRFFRLHNGLWIRTRAGRHKKLWRKKHRRIKRLREHVVCNDTQCRMLDKMVNIEYKKPTYFVEDPYTPYHRKSNLPDYRYRPPKFLP